MYFSVQLKHVLNELTAQPLVIATSFRNFDQSLSVPSPSVSPNPVRKRGL